MAGSRKPHLSLAQGAWIIVLVPALVGIMFSVILGSLCLDIEKTVREQASVSLKLNLINHILQLLGWELEASLGWNLSGSEHHKEDLINLSKSVSIMLERLKEQSSDDAKLSAVADSSIKISNSINTPDILKRQRLGAKTQAQKIIALHTPLHKAIARLYEKIESPSGKDPREKAGKTAQLIVVTFLSCAFISILFFAFFARRVTNRLSMLKDNAAALAAGKPLTAKLSGHDELTELEDKLIDLSAELAIARQRKQDFLSMIGHDLRSPLTSLQMTLEMFTGGVYGNLDQPLIDDVGKHLKDVRHLVTFISDLLELEKLEAGLLTLNTTEVALNSVLDSLVANLPIEFKSTPANFEVTMSDSKPVIACDPDRLEIALNRLVTVCLIDTPGPVKLRVSDIADQAKVLITIETRPGHHRRFSADHVFDRFALRSDKQTLFQEFRHSLSLAQELLRMQGADVDVSFQPNSVRFNVSLKHSQLPESSPRLSQNRSED